MILSRAATAGAPWSRRGYGHGHGYDHVHDDGVARAARAAARCRRALREAQAQRNTLVADLLRYGEAREVLLAREAAEPAGAGKDALRRSLERLETRLVEWFDQLDALDARIAELESDLAFLTGRAGEGHAGEGRGSGAHEDTGAKRAAEAFRDAECARHLAALGLDARPATLVELKAAYRARLKAVHPDVSPGASTEAAAAATVAFAELRKQFVQS